MFLSHPDNYASDYDELFFIVTEPVESAYTSIHSWASVVPSWCHMSLSPPYILLHCNLDYLPISWTARPSLVCLVRAGWS